IRYAFNDTLAETSLRETWGPRAKSIPSPEPTVKVHLEDEGEDDLQRPSSKTCQRKFETPSSSVHSRQPSSLPLVSSLFKLSNMSDNPAFHSFLCTVVPSKFTAKANEDVSDWLTKVNRYFELLKLSSSDRVTAAIMLLDGLPAKWAVHIPATP
ncbi:hypothetical protein BGX30_012051, partial [Mortierella sp. GBA39]